jgi:class 3 adenylate cyclase/carbon monoxide dehydrogenase subunit G
MTTIYRYRKETHFAQPPQAVWPFLADTARLNEMAGSPPYQFADRIDSVGRTRRTATAKAGPLRLQWDERFGEWQENTWLTQERQFKNGPFRHFKVHAKLDPEGAGCRLIFAAEVECAGALGLLAKLTGQLDREVDKRVAAIEQMVAEATMPGQIPGASVHEAATPAGQRRLDALIADLARDPASHGLAPKLAAYLRQAPGVTLRGIRPLTLARLWHAPPTDTVELFLAAQQRGILAMGWDLLCPRCRGAKSRVERLHELPQGAHCSSCNIDYRRDFTRNVELTFRPEPWFRPLPEGELCMLGQASTPHVKLQAEVAAGAHKSFALALPPGAYRFRTVEAGGEADADIGADGIIPQVTASAAEISLQPNGRTDELVVRNDTDRPLFFVVENRNWAQDALTGERVIAMPAFRRLCPEQLLHPGDDVEIGRVAIMFTDLQGSTKLYDDLGDATAYRLVRDHFAFLSERVQRHNGFVVKTVGDAVMAAFGDPADAVRAVLSIQDEVEAFNRGRSDAGIVLKLGLHQGACIAVTVGGVLVSEAVIADAEAREVLAGRTLTQDSATLRGLSEPVRFVRVGAAVSL